MRKYRLGCALLIMTFVMTVSRCDLLSSSEEQKDPDPNAIKVLFIGSSYLSFNNLPQIFKQLSLDADKNVFIGTRIIDGTYLDFHADSKQTQKKIDEQDWDFIVLQGGCQTIAYPETHADIDPRWGNHPVAPSVAVLKEQAIDNHPESNTVYSMPWAFEDGMTWINGLTDDYDDMQLEIRRHSLQMAEDLDIMLAPIGMAWYEVLMNSQPPLHYLHLSDWNHPSTRGSYLSACVIYTTIFQESVEGNGYRAGIPQNEVAYFQEVATATVMDSLVLWNILPMN